MRGSFGDGGSVAGGLVSLVPVVVVVVVVGACVLVCVVGCLGAAFFFFGT